jgi:hypothetical protein
MAQRDEEIDNLVHEEDKIGIDVNDKSKVHEFLPRLNDILRSGTSNENWVLFQETLSEITDKVKIRALKHSARQFIL